MAANNVAAGGQGFVPTAELLATDGILVGSRAISSASAAPFGGSGLNAARAAGRGASSSSAGGKPSRGVGVGGVVHDNYLTGRLLVHSATLASDFSGKGNEHHAAVMSSAPDPGDLHSLPPSASRQHHLPPLLGSRVGLPTSVLRHGMQVTAAARSCSGELVAVPPMAGAYASNSSATHPSADGGSRYDSAFIFRGYVAPTARTIPEEVDAMIRGEVDVAQAAAAKAAQLNKAATIIQSLARMRFARRRYLLHRQRLAAVLQRVFYEQQMRCALLIQKSARRMLARHRYLRMRDAQWQKFIANGGSSGGVGGGLGGKKKSLTGGGIGTIGGGTANSSNTYKGGGGGAGAGARAVQTRRSSLGGASSTTAASGPAKPLAPLPNEPYPWLEGISERHFTFVVALKAMLDGRLEEAKHAFEAFSLQQQNVGGDKVSLRLAHCCDARLRAIANIANGGREAGAGDKKGGGAKGAAGAAKGKSQSPARRR